MGCILGAIVGAMAYKIMGISWQVAAVVCCTMPITSMIAAALGASIPLLCLSLRLDPTVIAAPAMTSLVDVAGLMCYFLMAQYVFNLLGLEL
mmetsp:Transcript_1042/g.1514  ORF Transcript_1042/g.1514 Transcript_1042/m.1514 type:complete len:92 (+) Transcript_1042:593-868(+)